MTWGLAGSVIGLVLMDHVHIPGVTTGVAGLSIASHKGNRPSIIVHGQLDDIIRQVCE